MSGRTLFLAVIGAFALMVAYSTLTIVYQHERAVKLRFGKIIEADIQPGLTWRLPVAEEIKKFDGRVLTLDNSEQRYLTVEKKALIVDAFVKWRVSNVERFYTATSGDLQRASRLLSQRVDEGLRNEFAIRTKHEVVSGERDELMVDLKKKIDSITEEAMGVEIYDIRVKKIDLPSDVSNSVFSRMTSDREKEAREYRSKGRELAEGIRADADRQATIIEAEAYKQAEILRGQGDSEAARIYAEAFSQDPEFYAFYRSLQAYKRTFNNKADVLLLDPDSEFFKYLSEPDLAGNAGHSSKGQEKDTK